MTRRRKHLPSRQPPQWQHLYDGRDLLAVIERRADGWHAVLAKHNEDLGASPTRGMAISMVNARKAKIAAAPITGERSADIEHIKAIQLHQRAERERSARRAVGSKR
jgi:hypothetical protein